MLNLEIDVQLLTLKEVRSLKDEKVEEDDSGGGYRTVSQKWGLNPNLC